MRVKQGRLSVFRARCIVLAIVASLLFSVIAVAEEPAEYQITPWTYGAIVWVGAPADTDAVALFAATATIAVEEVFAFWGSQPPAPSADAVWIPDEWPLDLTFAEVEGRPVMTIRRYDAENDTSLEIPHLGRMIADPGPEDLYIPPLRWDGEDVVPLVMIVFRDPESLGEATRDFSFSGRFAFAPSGDSQLDGSIDSLLGSAPSIALSSDPASPDDSYGLLCHESAHWFWDLAASSSHGARPADVPRLILEGFAEFTAASLAGSTLWQGICCEWAESFGLMWWLRGCMVYPLGAGLFAYLDESMPRVDLLRLAISPRTDWNSHLTAINRGWRSWAQELPKQENADALIVASLQSFPASARMLAPVLPERAIEIAASDHRDSLTSEELVTFWDLAEQAMGPAPAREVWEQLAVREPTFSEFARRNLGEQGRILADRVKLKLLLARLDNDWEAYHHWYMIGILDVIADGNAPSSDG